MSTAPQFVLHLTNTWQKPQLYRLRLPVTDTRYQQHKEILDFRYADISIVEIYSRFLDNMTAKLFYIGILHKAAVSITTTKFICKRDTVTCFSFLIEPSDVNLDCPHFTPQLLRNLFIAQAFD